MKPYQRKFTPEAKRLIRKLHPVVRGHVRALTDQLLSNPFLGKALQKELKGYYSIRHSHYRVVYSVREKQREVIIDYVGMRESVYEVFFEYLMRRKTPFNQ